MEYMSYPSVQKAMFEKSINTLEGIVRGIKADNRINEDEIAELQNWCLLQVDHSHNYPSAGYQFRVTIKGYIERLPNRIIRL